MAGGLAGVWSPEDYANKLKAVRDSAERVGRNPMAIVTANISPCLIVENDAELAEVTNAPLLRAWIMHVDAETMRQHGWKHPLGEDWRSFQDINPAVLPRERVVKLIKETNPEWILKLRNCGTPKEVARKLMGYVDAGLRVPKILNYAGVAGLKYGARAAQRVVETENELLKLVESV